MSYRARIIGAPTDYGTDRRGVDMGPSAIRYAGLADELAEVCGDCEDVGDLFVPRTPGTAAESNGDDDLARFLDETAEVCSELADAVADAIDEGLLPVVLGGDHSVAIGTMAGAAREADLGVVWFDAHGDYNTPGTSPSGNVHGMSLAAALGRGAFAEMEWARAPGLREENVVWVGLRDLDDEERAAIRESDATAFTMSDVDDRGISPVVDEALSIATDGVDGVHVSLDLDWLDPNEAPGVGTPVRGGVTYREAHSAMEHVAERDARDDVLRSLEFVEVNPILDQHNETAELAVELAASALGKRVL